MSSSSISSTHPHHRDHHHCRPYDDDDGDDDTDDSDPDDSDPDPQLQLQPNASTDVVDSNSNNNSNQISVETDTTHPKRRKREHPPSATAITTVTTTTASAAAAAAAATATTPHPHAVIHTGTTLNVPTTESTFSVPMLSLPNHSTYDHPMAITVFTVPHPMDEPYDGSDHHQEQQHPTVLLSSSSSSSSVTVPLDPVSMMVVAQKSLHAQDDTTDQCRDNHHDESFLLQQQPQEKEALQLLPNIITDVLSTYLTTEDVLYKVMNFLSVVDLVHGIGMVNPYYHTLSQQNMAGWDRLYRTLQRTKCHVPSLPSSSLPTWGLRNQTPQLLPQQPSVYNTDRHHQGTTNHTDNDIRRAYQFAVTESKRQFITLPELCYDISTQQGTIWSFRFKESAGADWTSVDPWYSGQPCRKMVFLPNGTMMQVIYPTQQQQQPQPTTTTTSTVTPPKKQPPSCHSEPMEFVEPPLRMTWRLLTRPMDLPTRPMGSYVRIQVGGRDVPTYATVRSPTGNWGFVLESCWGVYASFELPKRIVRSYHHNSNDRVLRRGSDGTAIWVPIRDNGIETTRRENGVPLHPQPIVPADMQDESMTLTNEVQWREAFLYNVGARVLPEGDEATYEFDRFWQNGGNNNITNNDNHTNERL
jgi:hypothetical protein